MKGKAAASATHEAADPAVACTNKLYEKRPFECDIFPITAKLSTEIQLNSSRTPPSLGGGANDSHVREKRFFPERDKICERSI